MRILNYGPYHTTNTIYCGKCGTTSHGEYQVNLNTVGCIPLPDGFVNEITISRNEFIDYKGDIKLKLPTIRQVLNAYKDKAFKRPDGRTNRELARICYMISSISGKVTFTPVEIKMVIQTELSSADYMILLNVLSAIVKMLHLLLLLMTGFFVRPWEISEPGETVEIQGEIKTLHELRQRLYENIIDETLFVSRASEGAVSADWLTNQPIFVRKKYVESFTRELKERERKLKRNK